MQIYLFQIKDQFKTPMVGAPWIVDFQVDRICWENSLQIHFIQQFNHSQSWEERGFLS